jgi:hypothetical protein
VAWVVVVLQVATAGGVLATRLVSPAPTPHAQAGAAADRRPAGDSEAEARGSAVKSLLIGRAGALLRRDRVAFLAGVDPGTPFHAAQARLFDALARVPLADVSYDMDRAGSLELPPAAAQRYRDPAWAGAVRMHYALAGYDTEPTVQEQYLTFVQRRGTWLLASDRDFESAGQQSARGLWDFGPVVALRSPRVLVLGHPGSAGIMHSILAAADAAVPRVSEVWPDWSGKVVVLVPGSAGELRRLVGHAGDLSRLAAIASADAGVAGGPPTGRRVAVNPAPFRLLTPFGRQVVLQHEITHVATRAVTSAATPYWLAEGFADYVGYQGTGANVREAARNLRADVAAGRLPAALPTAADFAGDSPRLAQAYEMSWLACRLIAARAGRAGLVRVYRDVSQGSADLDTVLNRELGMSTPEFVAAWRADIRRELG